LTTLLGTQMVEAVPAALVAALGKVALSGGGAASIVAAITLKKMLLLGFGMAIACAAFMEVTSPEVKTGPESVDPIPIASAPAENEANGTSAPEMVGAVLAEVPTSTSPGEIPGKKYVLSGIVVDESGQPIKNRAPKSNTLLEATMGSSSLFQGVNSDSTFELENPGKTDISGEIRARVPELNLVSDSVPFTFFNGVAEQIRLVVREGNRISGRALFADGSPIASASIGAGNPGKSLSGGSAQTNAQGEFELTALGEGEYHLTAIHSGQYRAKYPGASAVVNLEPGAVVEKVLLQSTHNMASVSGRVTDAAGLPVAGARLTSIGAYDVMFEAKAGPDGRYTIPAFAPGDSELSMSFYPHGDRRTVTAGAEHEDFVLGPPNSGTFFSILVKNADTSEPIQHYIIRFTQPGDDSRTDTFNIQNTRGEFSIHRVSDQESKDCLVSVLVPGFGMTEREIHCVPARTETYETYLFEIARQIGRKGTVHHADGRPAEGFNICAGDSASKALAQTDASGGFELPGIPAGLKSLIVASDMGLSSEFPINEEDVWDFVLPEAGSLSGRIVSDAGEPVEGCTVQLDQASRRSISHVVPQTMTDELPKTITDGNGRYAFDGLGAGPATLVATAPDGWSQRVEVQLLHGVSVSRDFVFKALDAELAGEVFVGEKAADSGVVLYPAGEGGEDSRAFSASIRIDGTFQIDKLKSGAIPLKFRLPIPRERRRDMDFDIKPGKNRARVEFAPGDATLVGTIPQVPGRLLQSLRVFLDISTAFGLDEVHYKHAMSEGGQFRIDGVPAGEARVECDMEYAPIDSGNGSGNLMLPPIDDVAPLSLEVTCSVPTLSSIMVVDASTPLPAFEEMTLDDFDTFQSENPPILRDSRQMEGTALIEDWPPLSPGAYNLVAAGIDANVPDEAAALERIRYTVLPFVLEAGKPTALKVDME
jgi:protocatechuate 3,4-dioxygenase beta subunit